MFARTCAHACVPLRACVRMGICGCAMSFSDRLALFHLKNVLLGENSQCSQLFPRLAQHWEEIDGRTIIIKFDRSLAGPPWYSARPLVPFEKPITSARRKSLSCRREAVGGSGIEPARAAFQQTSKAWQVCNPRDSMERAVIRRSSLSNGAPWGPCSRTLCNLRCTRIRL